MPQLDAGMFNTFISSLIFFNLFISFIVTELVLISSISRILRRSIIKSFELRSIKTIKNSFLFDKSENQLDFRQKRTLREFKAFFKLPR